MSLISNSLRILLLTVFLQQAFGFVSLDPRQDECVPCPTSAPSCPICPTGQICQIISQNCTQCAQSECIDSSSVGEPTSPSPNGPNTGAIAGGIAGALVVLVACLVGVFSWYIKKKRAAQDLDVWLDKSAQSTEDEEKESRRNTGSTVQHSKSGGDHHSITSTTISQASNVIPIGYNPSPLRNTMVSTETGYSRHDSMSTLPSPRSHPPTQFFSADDILRASLASNRDTQYSDRDTVYSDRDTRYTNRDTRYSNRDSVGTTYTRASIATRASLSTNPYRSTAIITPAPVPVPVRAQPKVITFGKHSAPPSPIPAVPELTAEKVAEAERARATNMGSSKNESSQNISNSGPNSGMEINIPITLQPGTPRLSTISSAPAQSPTLPPPRPIAEDDGAPESPVLGDEDSYPPTPQSMPPDLTIMMSPTSPTSELAPSTKRKSQKKSQVVSANSQEMSISEKDN